MTNRDLRMDTVPGLYAVSRLPADAPLPEWARGEFVSITRTGNELSIICEERFVPAEVRAERGWACMKVAGPIPFETIGVTAAISAPLAEAGISVLIVGTFDTDYVLVKEAMREKAIEALRREGFV